MTLCNASQQLRGGLTTGTCAAAAAKAALLALQNKIKPAAVEVVLPDGTSETIAIEECVTYSCTHAKAVVKKDAGDDPDITNGMSIVCDVNCANEDGDIVFCAGDGVGTVTKPGLQIPVGEPAINPVPRKAIAHAVREVMPHRKVTITLSIPGGAERARHTFNPKLGVEGGLSILGTSGRIVPRSEEAWFRSLLPQLDMAKAMGHRTIFVTPGSFGKELRKHFPDVSDDAVIHAGNFLGDVLKECGKRNFDRIILAGHIGKLVKIAAGIWNTHSQTGDARLETITAHAALLGAPSPTLAALMGATTTEAAVPILSDANLHGVWFSLAKKAAARAAEHAGIPVSCVLTAYGETVLGWTTDLNISFQTLSRPPTLHTKTSSIHVVGVGPGNAEFLSPAAWQLIQTADVIAGGARQLELVSQLNKIKIPITANLAALSLALQEHPNANIVVLASGDPTCYGILEFVKREFPERIGSIVPAVGSFQMALARLQKSWNEVAFTSAHGKSTEALFELVASQNAVLTLTDTTNAPTALAHAVCRCFSNTNFSFTVLERLGYPTEKLTAFTQNDIPNTRFDTLSVLLIEKTAGDTP
jgi:cobalt-precorrin-5B (C1)-methyltransferase